MMVLKAIALDDEIPALEVIEAFCSRNEAISLKATFTKTSEALKYLKQESVDLLFLDINMPAISGIDFAKKIDENILIIFTTSYAEYAVEGFNLNAVDYLLKPFAYKRFLQAIEKARTLYNARHAETVEPLLLRANYGTIKVLTSDILFIEGMDNYLKIYLKDQKPLIIRMPLKSMIERLPADKFLRVHRSFIVSIAKVDFVRNKTIEINDHRIPLGGKYEASFYQLFKSLE